MLLALPCGPWCEKELGFLGHNQRLHSSIQASGVRRGFPHPLSKPFQAWACSARERRGSGVRRSPGSTSPHNYYDMPQIGMKTNPELVLDSFLPFPIFSVWIQHAGSGQTERGIMCARLCQDIGSQGQAGPKRWREIISGGSQGPCK